VGYLADRLNRVMFLADVEGAHDRGGDLVHGIAYGGNMNGVVMLRLVHRSDRASVQRPGQRGHRGMCSTTFAF
jgi:hypothetical protein